MFKVGCFVCQFLIFAIFSIPASAQKKVIDTSDASINVDSDSKIVDSPQTESDAFKLRRGAKEFNFEAGYSPFEPTHFSGPKEYNTAGRKLGTLNFRLGRVIGTKKNITYSYLFGFTPFLIALKNEVTNKDYVSEIVTPNISPTKRETSYGVGINPVNFRFVLLANKRIKPYAQVGAGILLFNKAMPIPESRRLQFTGDFGGGLMIHRSPNKALFFGYKYFHISNGDLTPKRFNPGFNANVFYIGYSVFK